MFSTRFFVVAGLCLALVGFSSVVHADGCASSKSSCSADGKKSIVDTAVEAGSFNTLVAAAKAAGLVDALNGGPLTVFAPTDEAFAALPAGTVENLLKPENRGALASILKYHVVAGKLKAEEVIQRSGAVTLNGQRIDFTVTDGGVRADNAQVVKTDIWCSNGVIHVIDRVMLPADASIVETAAKAGTFKTLLAAAKAAGLAGILGSDGPFTVFAPTDEAFAKLPAGTVEMLLEPENKAKLARILKYHVVSGRVYGDAAAKAGAADTLQGQRVAFDVSEHGLRVQGARVVTADLDASNGVIHVIDKVLIPTEKEHAGRAY